MLFQLQVEKLGIKALKIFKEDFEKIDDYRQLDIDFIKNNSKNVYGPTELKRQFKNLYEIIEDEKSNDLFDLNSGVGK